MCAFTLPQFICDFLEFKIQFKPRSFPINNNSKELLSKMTYPQSLIRALKLAAVRKPLSDGLITEVPNLCGEKLRSAVTLPESAGLQQNCQLKNMKNFETFSDIILPSTSNCALAVTTPTSLTAVQVYFPASWAVT